MGGARVCALYSLPHCQMKSLSMLLKMDEMVDIAEIWSLFYDLCNACKKLQLFIWNS